MSLPYRILTVCLGNICRSPMSEYMLRAAFDEAGLGDEVEVTSAGTSAEEAGNRMDRRAVAALRRNGVPDLGWSSHRARRFDSRWFDDVDLVLANDLVHDQTLRKLARRADPSGEYDTKVRLLRSFDPEAMERGDLRMADPWYGDDSDFDITFEQIQAATPGVVEFVREELARRR